MRAANAVLLREGRLTGLLKRLGFDDLALRAQELSASEVGNLADAIAAKAFNAGAEAMREAVLAQFDPEVEEHADWVREAINEVPLPEQK
jgi:hypothetical protein